ncbi:MAG TPA: SRPBCC family protein [Steroidobacteraceae bacterium]|jgi:uncharacterized membrane protein
MTAEPVGAPSADAALALQRPARHEGPVTSDQEAESDLIGRSVTVDRPRSEVYGYWRDFTHLPRFMSGIRRVEVVDSQHARWIVGEADDQSVWETEILEARTNALISWSTSCGSHLLHRGQLEFRDAPGGRGTVITATLSYEQTGGRVGELLARLFHRDPRMQAYQDLRRFKQLMETGEIATAAPPDAAPRA